MSDPAPDNIPRFELRHRLDLALEHAGLRPDDMASELAVSLTTIRNYRSGRTVPTRATLIAWALRCGVPLDWLLYGDTSTPDPNGPGAAWYAPRDSNPEPAGQQPALALAPAA